MEVTELEGWVPEKGELVLGSNTGGPRWRPPYFSMHMIGPLPYVCHLGVTGEGEIPFKHIAPHPAHTPSGEADE